MNVMRPGHRDIINRHIKSIVQPLRVPPHLPKDPHHFLNCLTVDVHGVPITGPFHRAVVWEGLRLNHYISRSIEEANVKMSTPRVNTHETGYPFDLRAAWLNEVVDVSMIGRLEELRVAA